MMMSRWMMLVAAGLLLPGCGRGAEVLDAGAAPTRPAAESPAEGPTGQGRQEPDAGEPSPAVGSVPTPDAAPAVGWVEGASPSPASVGQPTTTVTVYLTRGEQLAPVTRTVASVPRIGGAAVSALLEGPTAAEAAAGLGTAIPSGTRLLGLEIRDRVATVDLSRSFESGGGSLGLTLRLAQVVCTLDAFDTVRGVRFALDGQVVEVFSGEGIVLTEPAACDDYRGWLAAGDAASFPGIWPFTSQEQVEAYAGGDDRTFRDPVATARAFAEEYLGMVDPIMFPFSEQTSSVGVTFGAGEGGVPRIDPRPTMVVGLRQLAGEGPDRPWTVTGASADTITLTSPSPLTVVGSPLRLTGRALTFEGHVDVEVREDGMTAGQTLGRGWVTGSGSDEPGPFDGIVSFQTPTRSAGALVLAAHSPADGSLLHATVVRVGFASG